MLKLIIALAGLVLVTACTGAAAGPKATPLATPTSEDSPVPPSPLPLEPFSLVALDGVTYRAETRVEKASPTADVAPITLRPWVTITNTGNQPAQVRLEGCPVSLRLYADASRSGVPVWTQEDAWKRSGGQCMQDPYVVALGPGESDEVAEAFRAAPILNDGVPPGRYYATITLALSGQTLELAAGEVELTYGLEGLAFKAQANVGDGDSNTLGVSVTVTNFSDKSVRIEYGDCALSLLAYDNPDRSGAPVRDGIVPANGTIRIVGAGGWEIRRARFCNDYLAIKDLAPGESHSPREFRTAVPIADIMDGALPDGRYYFTAVLNINGTSIEVPAGEAELRSAQDPR